MWRYKMKGDSAWKSWSPFTGAAFFADGKDPKTVTDFEVSADITVHKGPMDDLNPLGFEAGPLSHYQPDEPCGCYYEAKVTKQTINHQRIYPPLTESRADLLAAAAPSVQAPPPTRAKA